MTKMLWLLLSVWALGAAVRVEAAAFTPGEADARATAVRLLDEGNQRFEAADYEAALARFLAARNVFPSPKIFLNIAATLEKLGRDAEAAEAYEQYLAEAHGAEESQRRRIAVASLEQLRKRVGRLRITLTPKSASLSIDGQPRSLSDRPIYAQVGERAVAATASGYLPKSVTVSVPAGGEMNVELVLESAARASSDPIALQEKVPADSGPAHHPGRGLRIAGLTSIAAGVVAIALGVKFGLDAADASDRAQALVTPPLGTWSPGLGDQVNGLLGEADGAERNMYIAYAAGGTLVLGGVGLYLWGGSVGAAKTALRWTPTLTWRSAGMTLLGRFE